MFLGLSGTSDAILSMSNRPASQGGGSGEISNTPFTVDSSTNLTVSGSDANVRIRVSGASGSGPQSRGHYVESTILMERDQTYHLFKDSRYASVNYGAGATGQSTVILLGAQGGFQGSGPFPGPGGAAGLPSGGAGGSTGSSGGGGGVTYGYLSGSGGPGGPAGGSSGLSQTNLGGVAGGAMYPGPAPPGNNYPAAGPSGIHDGLGGKGGMGYYGGGGGGGGWQYGPGPQGSGGGGGSSYNGGIPPSGPYPVPVTPHTSGPNNGASYITFVSFEPA